MIVVFTVNSCDEMIWFFRDLHFLLPIQYSERSYEVGKSLCRRRGGLLDDHELMINYIESWYSENSPGIIKWPGVHHLPNQTMMDAALLNKALCTSITSSLCSPNIPVIICNHFKTVVSTWSWAVEHGMHYALQPFNKTTKIAKHDRKAA